MHLTSKLFESIESTGGINFYFHFKISTSYSPDSFQSSTRTTKGQKMESTASSIEQVCFICKKSDSDDVAYGEWQTSAGHSAHQFCLVSNLIGQTIIHCCETYFANVSWQSDYFLDSNLIHHISKKNNFSFYICV